MSTCNRLELQTLGSQPVIMPKTLRDRWVQGPPPRREEKKSKAYLTHEPRAMTMRLREPKRKYAKAVARHLQNHVVWSRTLKCSVKSYVTNSSNKYYFNEFLIMWGPHSRKEKKRKNNART